MAEQSQWDFKKIGKFTVINRKLRLGVFRGFSEDENKFIVAKSISFKNVSNSDQLVKLIKRETNQWKKLESKCIVKLYDVSFTLNNIYMFSEYCQEGDLKEYLKKKKDHMLSEQKAIQFLKHIAEGFKELQKYQIIHSNIKPGNILLSKGCAKISEISFSDQFVNTQYVSRSTFPLYTSPQILKGTIFSSKCDVWSVGIVFYEMLYGKTPWTGKCEFNLFQRIMENPLYFPSFPVRSDKVKSLIVRMLQFSEEDRISWQEVFDDELIRGDHRKLEVNANLTVTDKDDLEKSVIENRAYIQNNLVINFLRNIEETDEIESNENILSSYQLQNNEIQNISENKNQYQGQGKQLLQKQINIERIHMDIMKINQYIHYERNISIFYNLVVLKIMKSFNSGTLQISNDLYFCIIFAICKCQNINLEHVNIMLKSQTSEFNPKLWENYQQSIEFKKIQKTITLDIFYSLKLFQGLKKKLSEIIESSLDQNTTKDNLKKFKEILSEKLLRNSNFNQIYQKTLVELLTNLNNIFLLQTIKIF